MVKVKSSEKSKVTKRKTVISNPLKKKRIPNKNINKRWLKKNLSKKEKKDKGVVYLSHIPHGFYDDQIQGYFSQFGKVTQVSVPKSKSGKAKGYAFIEFEHPEVAQIAAETMNNYLMFNRLLKAKYLPPDEQKPRLFKKAELAKKRHQTASEIVEYKVKDFRKQTNRMLKTNDEAKVVMNLYKKGDAMIKKMAELGVTYEPQVDAGNFQSVLQRKANLIESRKLKRQTESKKKALEDKDDTSFSDKLLTSSENEALSSENVDSSKIKKSKRSKSAASPSRVQSKALSKKSKLVAKPLVLNPSSPKQMLKSETVGKNRMKNVRRKQNQRLRKAQKESSCPSILPIKTHKQKKHNLKTNIPKPEEDKTIKKKQKSVLNKLSKPSKKELATIPSLQKKSKHIKPHKTIQLPKLSKITRKEVTPKMSPLKEFKQKLTKTTQSPKKKTPKKVK